MGTPALTSSAGDDEEEEVTSFAFREPVRLRDGFGCRLAVHIDPESAKSPSVTLGAGETTLAVYDAVYDAVQEAIAAESPRGGVLPTPPPHHQHHHHHHLSSPSPRATRQVPPLYAQYGAAASPPAAPPPPPAADDEARYADDPVAAGGVGGVDVQCGPSPSSYKTARHRQMHGLSSSAPSPFT